jgi:hypothetical protein
MRSGKKNGENPNDPAFPASLPAAGNRSANCFDVKQLQRTCDLPSRADRSTAGAIGTYRPIEINDPKKRLVPIESG